MEPNRPSSSARRRFRISLTVWLGVVLLLASVAIASLSLRSHAGNRSAPEPAATAADGQRWMVLGYADVEGGVTPLYPQRPGQVKSIEARENETVQAGAPLIHLDDALESMQLQRAENALAMAKDELSLTQQKVRQYQKQIAAQKKAIEVARADVKLAGIQRDRLTSLRKMGGEVNDADLESAEATVRKAEAGVQVEESKLAVLAASSPEGRVQLAQLNIKDKEILLREARLALDTTTVRASGRRHAAAGAHQRRRNAWRRIRASRPSSSVPSGRSWSAPRSNRNSPAVSRRARRPSSRTTSPVRKSAAAK